MKILIYSDISLSRNYRAGNINAFLTLLEWLVTQGEVTICYTHFRRPTRTLPEGVRVVWRPDLINLFERKVRALFGCELPLLAYKNSFFKRHVFSGLIKEGGWDALIVEYLENAFLLSDSHLPKSLKVIVDLHDLMSSRSKSFALHGVNTKENLDIDLASELVAIAKFDKAICLQAPEAQLINKAMGRTHAIITRRFSHGSISSKSAAGRVFSAQTPLRIGFVGTLSEFNIDAAVNLLGELYICDGVEYYIAGSVCGALDKYSDCVNVKLLGAIDDLEAFYSDIDLFANMIRFGSGLKTKNVEALINGVPVITTSIGAEGFEDFIGRGLIVANDEKAFGAAVHEFKNSQGMQFERRALQCSVAAAFDSDVVFASLKTWLCSPASLSDSNARTIS